MSPDNGAAFRRWRWLKSVQTAQIQRDVPLAASKSIYPPSTVLASSGGHHPAATVTAHGTSYSPQVTVLIDPPRWPAHGRLWSHLVSDTSFVELHDFAAANGVPERGFDHDHYDVPEERYRPLIDAGAEPVDSRELLRRIGAAGLRRPKRDRRASAGD